jgi:DNA-binding transcriptional MocR family regulator
VSKTAAPKFQFIDALNTAQDLKPLARQVGILLVTRYLNGKTGVAYPSYTRIADDIGAERESVMRSVGQLVRQGWFTKRTGGSTRNTNVYGPVWEKVTERSLFDAETVTTQPSNGNHSVGKQYPTGYPNLLSEPSEGTHSPSNDEFDAFWQQYPRKVGKKAARTAYAKARAVADADTILNGVMRYAAAVEGDRSEIHETSDHLAERRKLE